MEHSLMGFGHNTGMGGNFGRLVHWLSRFENASIKGQANKDAASYDQLMSLLKKKTSEEMAKADIYRAYVNAGIVSIAGVITLQDAKDMIKAVEKTPFENSDLPTQMELLLNGLTGRSRSDLVSRIEGMSLDGFVAIVHCIRMHLFYEQTCKGSDSNRPLLVESFPILWAERCPFCKEKAEVQHDTMAVFCECGAIGGIYYEDDLASFEIVARDILGAHKIDFHKPVKSEIHEPYAKWYVHWARKAVASPRLVKS